MRTLDVSPHCWAALLHERAKAANASSPAERVHEAAWQVYEPLARRRSGSFVVAQVGQSLDGRVATVSGDARDISGPDGLAHLHRLRALADAVIVGVGTVTADDPRLTVREVKGPCPVRVVIDPRGRIGEEAGVLNDGGPETLVVRRGGSQASSAGNVLEIAGDGDRLAPREIVAALAGRGLRNLLLEGGATTIAAFLEDGMIDRLHVAVSPIIIGSGPAGIELPPIERLSDAIRPVCACYGLGSDILFDLDLSAR